MRKRKSTKKYEDFDEIFDNVWQFAEAVNTREANPAMRGEQESHNQSEDFVAFCGTSDYKTADDLLRNGDNENLQSIRRNEVKKHRAIFSNSTQTRISRGVAGNVPNVPAYIMGLPTNMMTARKERAKEKIVNLLFNIGANASFTAEEIAEYGAKIATLVNSYELAGVRCKVYAFKAIEAGGQHLSLTIKVKDSSAPLNRLALAYLFVNPSFYRRHTFAWLETCPAKIHENFVCGYGQTMISQNKLTSSGVLERVSKHFHGEAYEYYDINHQPRY